MSGGFGALCKVGVDGSEEGVGASGKIDVGGGGKRSGGGCVVGVVGGSGGGCVVEGSGGIYKCNLTHTI